jgi:uncharacterized membrane protein
MAKLLYALAVAIVGAGIVHIAILLMLPAFSERDAWSKLTDLSDDYTVTRVAGPPGQPAVLQSSDPFFNAVACRFDLTNGVTHLTGQGAVPFWSASVYDRNGQNIYSFNDRTATEGALDFVIATPLQMTEVRKNLPPIFKSSVFVEADIDEGIVVIRTFVSDDSWKRVITQWLDSVSCRTTDALMA